MQLDNTRIAVRERGMNDIFDLGLHVFRQFAGPLLVTFFLGAAPLMLVNHLLVGWLMDVEYREAFFFIDEIGTISRYVWLMSMLITIEAPLASVFTTAYLGQSVFVDRPRIRDIVRDVFRMLPQVLWCQLLIRGVLAAWLLLLAIDRQADVNWGLEVVMFGFLAVYVLAFRYFRPFINEIVLLEKNPLIARGQSALTVGRRSAQLHDPSASDLFARGLATTCLAIALSLACFSTLVFAAGVCFNSWKPGPRMLQFALPLGIWFASAYLTVVRFLSYLDLRIRHEGWEVELRMRAEAARLTKAI